MLQDKTCIYKENKTNHWHLITFSYNPKTAWNNGVKFLEITVIILSFRKERS